MYVNTAIFQKGGVRRESFNEMYVDTHLRRKKWALNQTCTSLWPNMHIY